MMNWFGVFFLTAVLGQSARAGDPCTFGPSRSDMLAFWYWESFDDTRTLAASVCTNSSRLRLYISYLLSTFPDS